MKIGIIGCGLVVENSHLPTLIAMGYEVIWVFDTNKKREKEIAQLIGIKNFISKNDFIEYSEPDIILIAVPYGLRKDIYKKLESNFSLAKMDEVFEGMMNKYIPSIPQQKPFNLPKLNKIK